MNAIRMRDEPERFSEKSDSKENKIRWNGRAIEPVEIRKKLKKGSKYFTKEFNQYFKTFITGAFSFVAALLWRDAISYALNQEKAKAFVAETFPFLGEGGMLFITAFIVTIVAVISITIVNRILKTD
ncbi:MAG: hypothetical protein JW701_00650 [Kosmotogaceae bacterium]|nr:hypothetical protein [Kosmotogaceae bacterium]